MTTSLSVSADLEGGDTFLWREKSVKKFDPASLKCVNNRCGTRKDNAQIRRHKARLQRRRCGWTDIDVTALLRQALRTGEAHFRVRMLLEHSPKNQSRNSTEPQIGTHQHRPDVHKNTPRVCVSFMGSLPSYMPDRFLPFISIVKKGFMLKLPASDREKAFGRTSVDLPRGCLRQTAGTSRPCHAHNVTYTLQENDRIGHFLRAGKVDELALWKVISPRTITVGECAGHCQVASPRTLRNKLRHARFFKNIFAAKYLDSEFKSTCLPSKVEARKLRFVAYQMTGNHRLMVHSFIQEAWPQYYNILECTCKEPDLSAIDVVRHK